MVNSAALIRRLRFVVRVRHAERMDAWKVLDYFQNEQRDMPNFDWTNQLEAAQFHYNVTEQNYQDTVLRLDNLLKDEEERAYLEAVKYLELKRQLLST